MELDIDSCATDSSISSKANSESNQRGDHKLAKRIVTARKYLQKPYGEKSVETGNQENEIIIEDGIKKCKNCANCDKKYSDVKPKLMVEISTLHDASETRN